jgi:hypothetical protein
MDRKVRDRVFLYAIKNWFEKELCEKRGWGGCLGNVFFLENWSY